MTFENGGVGPNHFSGGTFEASHIADARLQARYRPRMGASTGGDVFQSSAKALDKTRNGKFDFGVAAKNLWEGACKGIKSFATPQNLLFAAGFMALGAAATILTGGAAIPLLAAAGIAMSVWQYGSKALDTGGKAIKAIREGDWDTLEGDVAKGAGDIVGTVAVDVGMSVVGAKMGKLFQGKPMTGEVESRASMIVPTVTENVGFSVANDALRPIHTPDAPTGSVAAMRGSTLSTNSTLPDGHATVGEMKPLTQLSKTVHIKRKGQDFEIVSVPAKLKLNFAILPK